MSSETRASMLHRLRDGSDPVAWAEFYDRYWRAVYLYSKRGGCSNETAEEIVQEVMLAVFEKRQVFQYDPARGRFRGWLKTVVRNLISKHRRRPAERVRGIGGDAEEPVVQQEAGDPQPDERWETAFEQSVLRALLDVVRRETSARTFQAFELTALHGLSGERVAQITGLTRNGVYSARRSVLMRLRELGAEYREDGKLSDRLKEAVAQEPSPAAQRSLTTRIQETMRSR